MTGYNLPPGVTVGMIERAFGEDGVCECCGLDSSDCECPECEVCGDVGNPRCYNKDDPLHGQEDVKDKLLIYTKAQRLGQAKFRLAQIEQLAQDEKQYIEWLQEQPEDWKDT